MKKIYLFLAAMLTCIAVNAKNIYKYSLGTELTLDQAVASTTGFVLVANDETVGTQVLGVAESGSAGLKMYGLQDIAVAYMVKLEAISGVTGTSTKEPNAYHVLYYKANNTRIEIGDRYGIWGNGNCTLTATDWGATWVAPNDEKRPDGRDFDYSARWNFEAQTGGGYAIYFNEGEGRKYLNGTSLSDNLKKVWHLHPLTKEVAATTSWTFTKISLADAKTTTDPVILMQNDLILHNNGGAKYGTKEEFDEFPFWVKLETVDEAKNQYNITLYNEDGSAKQGYLAASVWSSIYLSGEAKGDQADGATYTIADLGENKYSIRLLGAVEGNYNNYPNNNGSDHTGDGYVAFQTSGYWRGNATWQNTTASEWEFYTVTNKQTNAVGEIYQNALADAVKAAKADRSSEKANKDVKAEYADAYTDAKTKSTTAGLKAEVYENAKNRLDDANKAMDASVKVYQDILAVVEAGQALNPAPEPIYDLSMGYDNETATSYEPYFKFYLKYLTEIPAIAAPVDSKQYKYEALTSNADLSATSYDSYAIVWSSAVNPKPSTTQSDYIAEAKNGKVFAVSSVNNAVNSWDSQFFIVLNEPMQKGETLYVQFAYMAAKAATLESQSHNNPGTYNGGLFGNINATTEWQICTKEVTLTDDDKVNHGGLKSIAFNLNNMKESNIYCFANASAYRKINKAAAPAGDAEEYVKLIPLMGIDPAYEVSEEEYTNGVLYTATLSTKQKTKNAIQYTGENAFTAEALANVSTIEIEVATPDDADEWKFAPGSYPFKCDFTQVDDEVSVKTYTVTENDKLNGIEDFTIFTAFDKDITYGELEVWGVYMYCSGIPVHTMEGLKDGNMYTVCLPYAADVEGAIVYEISGTYASGIDLNYVQTLEAGKPYIIVAIDKSINFYYLNGTVKEDQPIENNGLIGTFTDNGLVPQATATDQTYIIKNNKLYKVNSAVNFKANKAYINLSKIVNKGTSSSVKGMALTFAEDVETAISEISDDDAQAIFSANGIQQSNLKKGVNIVKMNNGTIKKVLVK